MERAQFQTIFLDLDDTLLDFGAAERVAISKTFRDIGLEPTEALLARYRELNEAQWEAFERGELTREQAKNYPGKNLITRAVGIEPEVRVDTGVFDWHDGDTVLLCSDGLSNTVKLPQMQAILAEEKADGARACRRLIDLANRNGGPDNITVAVLKTDEE